MSPTEIVTLVVAVMTALGIREIIAKAIDRRSTKVAADKTVVETSKTEVQILREVIAEVRADSSSKDTVIARQDQKIDSLDKRVEKLEERERHALTRAAVHEAWDRLAFEFILQHKPDYPPPPSLTPPGYDPFDHT